MELAIIIGIAISTFTAFTYVFVYFDQLKEDLISSNCRHNARFDTDEYETRKLKERVEKLEDKSNDGT